MEDLPLEEHLDQLYNMPIEQALGIDGLRDVEAALDCLCSCHTRWFGQPSNARYPGTKDKDPHHDGGKSCPCQRTEEERKQSSLDFRKWLDEHHRWLEESGIAQAQRRDKAEAEELALSYGFSEWKFLSIAAPLQWEGTYQGDYIYFRERHGTWRLERSESKDAEDETVIARGHEGEFAPDKDWMDNGTEGIVTRSVRMALEHLDVNQRQNGCEHARATEDDVFCRDCGQRIVPLY